MKRTWFYMGKRVASRKKRTGRLRSVSLVLAVSLLLGLCLPAFATSAGSGGSSKEEVIYINLNYDGSVDRIYVVNIFELDESGQIVDYGNYTALRNMTTEDDISFVNQVVRINTDERRLYYEGTLDSNVIPWRFELHYYLDGEELKGEDLAGKSGALRITFDIAQNTDCISDFFENFALQARLTLDTEVAENVVAEDATRANVGGDVQLSYMILPDREEHYEITADVTEFEMDGLAINGVHMNMTFTKDDITDTEELDEKVEELQNGAKDLDEGADDLMEGADAMVDGTEELRDGTEELRDGTDELSDGAAELYDGASDLKDGAEDLTSGADELKNGVQIVLDGAAELRDGAKDLKDGAKDLYDGARSLRSGLNTLTAQNNTLQTMSNTLYNQTLTATGSALEAEGYTVTADTTADALTAMLQRRQEELVSNTAKQQATQQAIQDRIGELQDGEPAKGYWQMTVLLQQMEAYQQALAAAETDEQRAQINEQLDNTQAQYHQLVSVYGSYEELATSVGESENALIEERVTTNLTESVTNDSIYQALAVLTYYRGVVAYTNGVASAASGASSLASGASSLASGAHDLYDGAGDLYDGADSLYSGLDELLDGATELGDGCYELSDGTLTLMDGVITLQDGIVTLQDGVITLYDGTVTLCDGAIELYDGTVDLKDGTVELKDGTTELRDKTATMRDEILDHIVNAVNDLFGADFLPLSFVDQRNENVEMLQFVIQTPDISIPDVETETPEPVHLTFWQKLLALFGL